CLRRHHQKDLTLITNSLLAVSSAGLRQRSRSVEFRSLLTRLLWRDEIPRARPRADRSIVLVFLNGPLLRTARKDCALHHSARNRWSDRTKRRHRGAFASRCRPG